MNATNYAEKAQEHNDITAAAAILADARRVVAVEGGHYVTEFDNEGQSEDGDEVTVRVKAKVRDEDEATEGGVLSGLSEVGEVVEVEREEKSGFYSPVTHKNGFAQPARTPKEDAEPEWSETRLTVTVRVFLTEEDDEDDEEDPVAAFVEEAEESFVTPFEVVGQGTHAAEFEFHGSGLNVRRMNETAERYGLRMDHLDMETRRVRFDLEQSEVEEELDRLEQVARENYDVDGFPARGAYNAVVEWSEFYYDHPLKVLDELGTDRVDGSWVEYLGSDGLGDPDLTLDMIARTALETELYYRLRD